LRSNLMYRVSHNTWDYKNAGKYLILKLKIILFKRELSGFDAWTFL
jgi:hypothetical protein